MFLQILGIIFLVLLAAAGWFGWQFYRRVHTAISGGDNFSRVVQVLPEMQLNLATISAQQLAQEPWHNHEQLQQLEQQLTKIGAVHEGYFVQYLALAQVRLSLWNVKNAAAFVFYEGVPRGDNVDISFAWECIARLNTGGTLTITNSEFHDTLPRPREDISRYTDERDPVRMLALLKKHLPADTRFAPIKSVRAALQQSFEKHNEWLWREEQLRSEKLATLLSTMDIELTDELVSELVGHGHMLRSELRTDQVIKRFSANAKISVAQWEDIRDRLIVIHDDMTMETLISAIYDLDNDLDAKQEAELDRLYNLNPGINALTEFRRLQTELGVARQCKRLAATAQPVNAEIYLVPR